MNTRTLLAAACGLGLPLLAQGRAVVPAVAEFLPGNAALSMPLRWSQGVMQCCIGAQLLPPSLAGAQITGLRLRRPAFLAEPAYASVQRTITVRAAFTPLLPSALSTSRAGNTPAAAVVVAGPTQVAVAASANPTGSSPLGDEFLVLPFSTPLPVGAGSLFLEFETTDAPLQISEQWVDAVWNVDGVDHGYVATVGVDSCTTLGAPLRLTWSASDGPLRGADARLRLQGAPASAPNGPGALALSFIGVGPRTHALAPDFFGFGADLGALDPGLAGCRQWAPLDLTLAALTDASGGVTVQFPLPVAATTVGMQIGVQSAFLDLSRTGIVPLSLSNGVVLQLDRAGVGAQCSAVFFPGAAATSPWPVELGLMPVLVIEH